MATKSTALAISSLVNPVGNGKVQITSIPSTLFQDNSLGESKVESGSEDESDDDSEDESEHESESESDAEPPTQRTLDEAITSATNSRVRSLLRQMCGTNAICHALASRVLLVGKDVGSNCDATSGNKKRSRQAFETCCQCNEEYDVMENELDKRLCEYHPGEKEVNDEHHLWDDMDPDCHGVPDDFEDDPNYAEGFLWSCCEKDGEADGCKTTKHRTKTKRTRFN